MLYEIIMKRWNNQILYVLAALLLCTSCKLSEDATSEFKYVASVDVIEDTVQFQDIVESYRLIPLQTTGNNRIGEVSDLIVKDSLMYVVSDGVFCFDKAGTFKFAISQKGHAQNEFVKVSSVNVTDDNIYLYDVMQGKVLVFDNKNGEFRRSIKIPHTVASLFCDEDEIVADRHALECTAVPNDERFFTFSTEQPENVSQAYLADAEDKTAINGQTTMYDNGFFFSNFWKCQTWKINAKECVPYFQLLFSQNLALSENELQTLIESRALSNEQLSQSEKAWGLLNVHETDNMITGRFQVGSALATFVYNKENDKCVAYKSVKCEGPWQPIPMDFMASYKKNAYGVVSSDDIAMIKSFTGLPTISKQEVNQDNPYDIYCSVEENDNPVVVEFVLK